MGVINQLDDSLLDLFESSDQGQRNRLRSVSGRKKSAKDTSIKFGEEQSHLATIRGKLVAVGVRECAR